MEKFELLAISPTFTEDLLAGEIKDFGIIPESVTPAGVKFKATITQIYQILLWSRIASRILLKLKEFPVSSNDELYSNVNEINWEDHMRSDSSFKVESRVNNSFINNSNYASLLVKDGVADYFKERKGTRPDIQTERPDINLMLLMNKNIATICIDLSGESLYKRGYRVSSTLASLKENTAAAMLIRAGWKRISESGGSFIDPMCGSGILGIEAGLMSLNIAPGLFRKYFGISGWNHNDEALFQTIKKEAEEKQIRKNLLIQCSDSSSKSIQCSGENIKNAGLENIIKLEKNDMKNISRISDYGLIAIDPPYGVRLKTDEDISEIYKGIGEKFLQDFLGWEGAVLTSDKEMSFKIGIRAKKNYSLYNGRIKCILSLFDIEEKNKLRPKM